MTLFDAGEPASAPPPADQSRLRLVVAYDGTDFHGFADQQNVRTVAGVLTEALSAALRVPGEQLDLVCAGRTDRGVHARGQVVTIDAPADPDPERVRRMVNGMLGPEVVVRAADHVAPDFDARRSARWRSYRYAIVNRPEPDPFLARYAWWVPVPLDLSLLRLGADPFVGEHDFAAFCRRGPGRTTVRTVLDSRWCVDDGSVLHYEIRSRAFCWQMVRAIVGMLVEVGTGRRRPGDVLAILRSRDRALAANLAPPHGLCLWEVGYDG